MAAGDGVTAGAGEQAGMASATRWRQQRA